MLCSFLLYSIVNQVCVYRYPLPLESPSNLTPIPALLVSTEHQAEAPVLYSSFPLTILHVVVYIYQCHAPNLSHLLSPYSHIYKSVLYICISIPALQIGLSVPEIPYIC